MSKQQEKIINQIARTDGEAELLREYLEFKNISLDSADSPFAIYENEMDVEKCVGDYIDGNFNEEYDEKEDIKNYANFMRKNVSVFENGIVFDLR